MSMESSQTRLELMVSEMRSCRACPLSSERTNVVPGTGPIDAEVMFIGEAPGANEDIKGEPFVGQSGKLLDTLLSSIELDRDSVYITNTVKCRPPNNRDPLPSELDTCQDHWLDAQIALIQPRIIVPLGRHALNRILPGTTIGKSHGKTFHKLGFTIYPIYHPAAGLRQIRYKELLIEDFKNLKTLLGNEQEPSKESKQNATNQNEFLTNENEQINLF